MIDSVRGRIAAKSPAEVVVDVHGLSLSARISLTTYDKLPSVGNEAQIFTRLLCEKSNSICLDFRRETNAGSLTN